MGLLDDAIREHLDLKRRRGANPDELERAEREALGPVRRGPDDADADQVDADLGSTDQPVERRSEGHDEPFDDRTEVYNGEQSPSFGHVPPPVEEEGHASEEGISDEFATRPHRTPAEPTEEQAPSAEPESPPAEREHPDAPTPSSSERGHGGETAEHDMDQELDKKTDDVLEETPDFLQDTPDHDRLWFEQRPPRDFDFEG
jgi:hypothetical protein